jgi:hypothetical protein
MWKLDFPTISNEDPYFFYSKDFVVYFVEFNALTFQVVPLEAGHYMRRRWGLAGFVA